MSKEALDIRGLPVHISYVGNDEYYCARCGSNPTRVIHEISWRPGIFTAKDAEEARKKHGHR